jgi:hypothetical protein
VVRGTGVAGRARPACRVRPEPQRLGFVLLHVGADRSELAAPRDDPSVRQTVPESADGPPPPGSGHEPRRQACEHPQERPERRPRPHRCEQVDVVAHVGVAIHTYAVAPGQAPRLASNRCGEVGMQHGPGSPGARRPQHDVKRFLGVYRAGHPTPASANVAAMLKRRCGSESGYPEERKLVVSHTDLSAPWRPELRKKSPGQCHFGATSTWFIRGALDVVHWRLPEPDLNRPTTLPANNWSEPGARPVRISSRLRRHLGGRNCAKKARGNVILGRRRRGSLGAASTWFTGACPNRIGIGRRRCRQTTGLKPAPDRSESARDFVSTLVTGIARKRPGAMSFRGALDVVHSWRRPRSPSSRRASFAVVAVRCS